MTSYASHVAAVPGPPFLILACALPVAAWVAWRAWHDQPSTFADWNCWRLVASDWPRHVRVIHDTPETTT